MGTQANMTATIHKELKIFFTNSLLVNVLKKNEKITHVKMCK